MSQTTTTTTTTKHTTEEFTSLSDKVKPRPIPTASSNGGEIQWLYLTPLLAAPALPMCMLLFMLILSFIIYLILSFSVLFSYGIHQYGIS